MMDMQEIKSILYDLDTMVELAKATLVTHLDF